MTKKRKKELKWTLSNPKVLAFRVFFSSHDFLVNFLLEQVLMRRKTRGIKKDQIEKKFDEEERKLKKKNGDATLHSEHIFVRFLSASVGSPS